MTEDNASNDEDFLDINDERSDDLAAQRRKDQSLIVARGVPSYPAFEVLTISQKVTVSQYLLHRFGLNNDDAVVNLFGLPFIPIPQPRMTSSGNHYRALPKMFSRSPICVHPIYWVSEDVYGEIPSDTSSFEAQRWATRMFAFLLLCGYYDTNYTFRDYLSREDRQMFMSSGELNSDMSSELMTYLDALGGSSVFDGTDYLSFDSINVDPRQHGFETKREYFDHFANRIRDKCDAVVNETASNTFHELTTVLGESDVFLFEKEGKGKLYFDPDESGSWWDLHAANDFFHIENNYADVLENNAPIQLLESAVREYDREVEEAVMKMNRIASTLIGPILSQNPNLSDKDVAALTTYSELAADTDEYAESPYEYSAAEIISGAKPNYERMLDDDREAGPLHEEAILHSKDFLEERRVRYNEAWMRLFLVRYNYDRSLDREPLETSFHSAAYKLRTAA